MSCCGSASALTGVARCCYFEYTQQLGGGPANMKHVMQGSRQRDTNLGATLCSLSRLRGAHGNAPTARQKIHTATLTPTYLLLLALLLLLLLLLPLPLLLRKNAALGKMASLHATMSCCLWPIPLGENQSHLAQNLFARQASTVWLIWHTCLRAAAALPLPGVSEVASSSTSKAPPRPAAWLSVPALAAAAAAAFSAAASSLASFVTISTSSLRCSTCSRHHCKLLVYAIYAYRSARRALQQPAVAMVFLASQKGWQPKKPNLHASTCSLSSSAGPVTQRL